MIACRPTSLNAICCALCRQVVAIGMAQRTHSGITHRPFERLHAAHRAARHAQQPRDAERIDQHLLQPHHVANGDHRKRQRIRPAGGGIDRGRPGGSLAAAQHVGADDEIAVGVERLARTDHVVPPARLAGLVADAGRVRIARESVRDQDGVRAVGIQMAVGLVRDLNRGKGGPAFERDTVETGALGFNNHRWRTGSW